MFIPKRKNIILISSGLIVLISAVFYSFYPMFPNQSFQKKVKRKTVVIYKYIFSHEGFHKNYATMLDKAGFIDVLTLDSSIAVHMKYATSDNITGKNLYKDFSKCYLHPEAARKLRKAQQQLKFLDSTLSIVVFDAVRPVSIQLRLWNECNLSEEQRRNFLSEPGRFSLHNFGMAVDCGLINDKGELIDMGTGFDFPGELAYPILENKFLAQGKLSKEQVDNRMLLREVMVKAGFVSNDYEWWHFCACTRNCVYNKYNRVDDFKKYSSPATIPAISISSIDPIVYKVQIAAAKMPLSSSTFKDNIQVNEYVHEGMYKYAVGHFTRFVDAFEMQESLKQQGYKDAFIVCFRNGERVSLKNN